MLFHLAHSFLDGRKHNQVVGALERLVDRHGEGNYADYTFRLTFPPNPNGLYLLKGGGPEVWRKFGLPRVIHGKRCGSTENVAPAGRAAWRQDDQGATARVPRKWCQPRSEQASTTEAGQPRLKAFSAHIRWMNTYTGEEIAGDITGSVGPCSPRAA